MDFSRRIYGYCERGFLPGGGADAFWAEPWNALTNGAFIIAAIIALVMALRSRRLDGPVGWLIVLTFAVGVGSFLFHTYAVVWAAMSDTIPIALFILSYFAVCMRCYAGFGWGRSLALVVAFLVILLATSVLLRFGIETPLPPYDGANRAKIMVILAVPAILFVARSLAVIDQWFGPRSAVIIGLWLLFCLGLAELANNAFPEIFRGMQSYFPAFLALLAIGGWLRSRGHPAGNWLLAVAVVFAVSLTFRALDRPLCAIYLMGTHWVWHVLNGVVLGSLVIALIRHGLKPLARA